MTGADLSALLKKHPLGAVGLLVCVLCGLAIYFRGSAIDEAQSRFEEKDSELQKITTNVRNLAGLQEQTNEIINAAKAIESRLIRAGNLAINNQIFYRLESETGVKYADMRQNPIPPARAGAPRGAYVGVPFSVSVQGSFQQVMTFLRRLESGQYFCRFNAVTFNKAGAGGAPDGMTVNIALELLGTQ
jgi:Tfp pilus assembly protein PilO